MLVQGSITKTKIHFIIAKKTHKSVTTLNKYAERSRMCCFVKSAGAEKLLADARKNGIIYDKKPKIKNKDKANNESEMAPKAKEKSKSVIKQKHDNNKNGDDSLKPTGNELEANEKEQESDETELEPAQMGMKRKRVTFLKQIVCLNCFFFTFFVNLFWKLFLVIFDCFCVCSASKCEYFFFLFSIGFVCALLANSNIFFFITNLYWKLFLLNFDGLFVICLFVLKKI